MKTMFRLAALLIALCSAGSTPSWAQRVSGATGTSRFSVGSGQKAISGSFQRNSCGFLRFPHRDILPSSHGHHSLGPGGEVVIHGSAGFIHRSQSRILHATIPGKARLARARREPKRIHIHEPPVHRGVLKHGGVLIIEIPTTVVEGRVNTHLVPGENLSGAEPERWVTQRELPRKSAKHVAPFDPTPAEVVKRMLEVAGVKKGDVVYDLGSGDGRIVIAAAKKYGVKAVGFEIDPGLVKLSRENIRKEGLEDLVEIRQEDFTQADFSGATVVTLYLSFDGNLRVRPLLQRQLNPGTRVVSYHFDMGDWQPKIVEAYRDSAGEFHTLYLWLIRGPFVFSENR